MEKHEADFNFEENDKTEEKWVLNTPRIPLTDQLTTALESANEYAITHDYLLTSFSLCLPLPLQRRNKEAS